MRLIGNRTNIRIDSYALISILVFIFSCAFQIAFNSTVVPMRSLPDEMGAIYLAAQLSGHDWTYVMTHPAMFYGFLWLPLVYPLFLFVSNPYILYQWLLGVCAVVRSIPALISGHMLKKRFMIDNKLTYIALSILSVFGTPTRSTNIDNEPLLVVLCWCVFAIIIELLYCNSLIKRRVYSAILGIALSLSLLAHTRAVVFYLVAIFTIVFVWLFCKRIIINIPIALGMGIGGYLLAHKVIDIVLIRFYPVDNNAQVANTGGELVNMLSNRVGDLFTGEGISSYFDGIVSNVLGTVIFGLGIPFIILCFILCSLWESVKNRIINRTAIPCCAPIISLIFPFCGLGVVILGVAYTWLNSTIGIKTGASIPSTRGYFYLRYYGMFISPLMVAFFATLKESQIKLFINMKRHISICIFAYLILVLRLFTNYLSYGVGRFKADWFYYFAPLSFSFTKWPDASQTGGYFYIPLMLVLLLIVVSIVLISKKRIDVVAWIVCIGLMYQYGYLVVFWDMPFSHSENYYLSANGIYDLNDSTGLIDEASELYCYGDSLSVQYNVQFVLPDVKVINDFPQIGSSCFYLLIVTDSIDTAVVEYSEFIPRCNGIFQIDDNEFIVVRGASYYESLSDLDVEELDHFDCIDYC